MIYFLIHFYYFNYREKVTRHLYYLQLKENVLNYRHLCSEERCFQLAAFALQADFGNYYPEKHQPGNYFDPREYFPAWVSQIGKKKKKIHTHTHTHMSVFDNLKWVLVYFFMDKVIN